MTYKQAHKLSIKVRRSVRAVSPVIATLLMIGITVAAALVAYAWVMGYFGNTTSKIDTSLVIHSVTRSNVYLENVGTLPVTLSNIFVNDMMLSDNEVKMDTSTPLQPSDIATINFTSLLKGKEVTVKVTTTDGTFVEHTATLRPLQIYYKTITFNNVAGSHSNFPVLISIAGDAQIAARATSQDLIYFTNDAGTQVLPHEITSFSTGGNIEAWVRVPTLTAATSIRIYYGTPPINAPYTPSVWDINYQAVWHMEEAPPTATLDSTSNARHGTPINMETGDQQTGQIDGSLNFNSDGSNEQVNTSNFMSGQAAITAEAWIHPTSLAPTNGRIVSKEGGSGSQSGQTTFVMAITANDPKLDVRLQTSTGITPQFYSGSISLNTWTHVAFTYDGNILRAYINGAEVGTLSKTGTIFTHDSRIVVGHFDGTSSSGDRYFRGSIDEVRISNNARSADWLLTQYRNTNNPTSFINLGGQQRETIDY